MPPAPISASTQALAYGACLFAIVGVAALWAGASLILGGLSSWIAVLAALDAALLLRLAGWPHGRTRVALALAVTGLTALVAGYFVATAQVGRVMGMRPYEALPRMSPELAWFYLQTQLGWAEAVWLALAGLVAWRAAK